MLFLIDGEMVFHKTGEATEKERSPESFKSRPRDSQQVLFPLSEDY